MRHLLSSFEILYHVIPQLQIAHFAGYFNLLSFVQSIYSISALQRINYTGNPYCNPRLAARIKVIRVRARNILMPASLNSIVFFLRFSARYYWVCRSNFLSAQELVVQCLILAYLQCLSHQNHFCFWYFRKSTPFAVVPINPFVPGKRFFIVQFGFK